MDIFGIHQLEELLNKGNGCAVSIYLPTHVTGRETREDPIRLKDLLSEVAKKLAKDMKNKEVRKLLAPAYDLVEDIEFWSNQSNTLILFLSKDFFKYYRLPIYHIEETVVDPQFYIAPLIPLIINNGSFYILAVSENYVEFYKANRYSIEQVQIPNMPESMSDALWYKQLQKEVQFHTEAGYKVRGAKRDAIFHGTADWIDKHKKYVVEYLRQVNTALKHYLNSKKGPLILAASKGLLPLYKEANTYKQILNKSIKGNPEQLATHELHRLAWELLQPTLKQVQDKIISDYKNLIGSNRFVTDLNQIIPAANDGLVEALFIDQDKHVWGQYDKNKRVIHTEKIDTPKNFDLLNLALIETITKKGEAYILPHNRMPADTSAAAVLRYGYVAPT